MKINFVSNMGESFASYRLRMLYPGIELAKRGHDVSLSKYHIQGSDICVYAKHYVLDYQDDARKAKQEGSLIFFDCCDYWHDDPTFTDYYKNMYSMADMITTSTLAMAQEIRRFMGYHGIVKDYCRLALISEPYEYEEMPPRFEPKGKPHKLFWFGSHANVTSIQSKWTQLSGNIVLILSDKKKIRPDIEFSNFVSEWCHASMFQGFHHCDMVVIPTDYDNPRTLYKSPNRVVESLRAGRFVLANHGVESYKMFKDYIWMGDNLGDGIEWAVSDKEKVIEKIREGQRCIKDVYSRQNVGRKWEQLAYRAMKA